MSRLLLCLVLGSLLGGCNPKGYIVVRVDSKGQLQDVARLRGVVTHDGRARAFELAHSPAVDIPPAQSFAIEVPPEVGGLIQLHLEALHSDGSVAAMADTQGLVADGKLSITFGGDVGDGGGGKDDLSRPPGDGGVQDLAATQGDLAGADLEGADLAAGVPCPNVMLVVDHTGSMFDIIPDGGTKLEAEVEAINAVVLEFESRVPIGLASFASNGACTDGVLIGPQPMVGNGTAIAAALAALTANGIGNNDVVLQQLQLDSAFLSRNPSYVIMITDNAPNCAGAGASGSDPTTTAAAASAAMSLHTNGFPVYVLGMNVVADPAALDTIAAGGGVPCSGATCAGRQYWPVSDTGTLTTQLRDIFTQVAGSCTN